jgi:tetratricopeptide (TPR) repeat protein
MSDETRFGAPPLSPASPGAHHLNEQPADAAALFAQALAHHQAGRLSEAEQLYRRLLQADPEHFDGQHLLGVIEYQKGDPEAALRRIDHALTIDPRAAAAHNNRGVVLAELKRFKDAIASYDQAIACAPGHVDAFINRGNALNSLKFFDKALANYDHANALQGGNADTFNKRGLVLTELNRCEEAIASYDRAIALKPDYAEAFNNRGNALNELNRFEAALADYERAIALKPDDALAFCNRGTVLNALNRFEEAVATYDKAIALRPDYADAMTNRGNALTALRRYEQALASYDGALAINPDSAEAHSNRGVTLQKLRQLEEALASFDRALALRPDYADAHCNRGIALQELHRFDEALASYDRALALRPDFAEALCNRGITFQDLKRFGDALENMDRALALRPDYAEAHVNRALLLLLNGVFDEGWSAYEWRKKMTTWAPRIAAPEWSGDDLASKRLLLYAEQGFGDTIQFVRYARLAAGRGARVFLEVQPPLKSLLAGVSGVAGVVAKGEPLPAFDLQCSLFSMPLMFKTSVETIPAHIPYISAPADRVAAWQGRLPRDGALVGLAWSGSPTHIRDHDRTMAFAQLAPLLAVPGVRFVSLQKEVRSSDAQALERSAVIDLRADLKDFADTAAVIAELDLVITVDTAVAHLAGAMGKLIWVMLPTIPSFRWLPGSPWYPGARLFPKSATRKWDEVVARVAGELAAKNFPGSPGVNAAPASKPAVDRHTP